MSSFPDDADTGSSSIYNSPGITTSNLIIVLAAAALFGLIVFMFALHIYVKCYWGRRRPEDSFEEVTGPTRELRRRPRPRRRHHHFEDESTISAHLGLPTSVVALLPTFVINSEAGFREDMECVVCLEEFVMGERVRLLPKCSHCFHVDCIDMWFLSHSSCPLCRCEVAPAAPADQLPPWPRYSAYRHDVYLSSSPSRSPMTTGFTGSASPPIVIQAAVSISDNASTFADLNFTDDAVEHQGSPVAYEMSTEPAESSSSQNTQEQNQAYSQSPTGLLIMRRPSPGYLSPLRSPEQLQQNGDIVFLEYLPGLNVFASDSSSTCLRQLGEQETTTPEHKRRRSYLAVEIIGEFQPSASESGLSSLSPNPVEFTT